ncbi:PREDICTED: protein phosphatase 1 regulatory subunit 3A [Elephantulus edwardii]|uniref:protein phosphatase 1 regulatory subunit 3A n=1 Tax=Elephantulus edwardii TaxID=28737 RepID=UPI0003F0A244|nr:PREDICTED: protein phosphatase 1 regulatory subunit 3A [Elephantulus edwardii]
MEPSEELSQISKDNFLEVPNLSDSLSEDEEVKATFKPGFSPQPSRRGSDSSEDMYLDTPSSGTRRVSFADNFGFNLVSVKEFDCWELPTASTNFDLTKDICHTEEYVLSPLFDLPSSKEDVMQQVQEQKAILESTEYPPDSTSMKGIIRVLNISFEKLVYVRMSLDDWQTHYDILAEYVPNSCDGQTDQFSFKISLVPPYQKDGIRVEFCIRYETSVGTFWSNNNGINYTLVCQKKKQELELVKPQEEVPSRQIKGCLKVKSSKEESTAASQGDNFENLKVTDAYIPTIVCSLEDKEDLETKNQNVKDAHREHDEHNEKELELMINERLMRTRSTSSREEKDIFSTDQDTFPNKTEDVEKKKIPGEIHSDFCKRPLSPSSSAESTFKEEFYHIENHSSGNKYSYRPSKEMTSGMGKIKTSLRDASGDELVQLHISSKEELDDNANPAQARGRVQISCSFSDQVVADSLKEKHKGEPKITETKDWEYLRRDFHLDESAYLEESTGNRSSKRDYGSEEDEDEQRIQLYIHEKGSNNFQPIFDDQEKKKSPSEVSVRGIGAHSRDQTALLDKDTLIPSLEVTADRFHLPRTYLRQEDVLTAPQHEFTTSEGVTFEGRPRNENALRNDYPFQVEKEKSDQLDPEDQNKKVQHRHNWNVLESQGKASGCKTNTTEHIKEQADWEDMWGKRDNTRSVKGTPTEQLFTCQETVHCALSSLADHGVTAKAEAGTACIIKTTSESTLESMSAREKAIIAKLPQETARSDRPIEEKETAFDPHEGRNDDSHYPLCQRDTVGVIYDNDFEKESQLGVCDVRGDEMEREEARPMYNCRRIHGREKSGIGKNRSADESLQVITGNHNTASKQGLHLEMLPKGGKIFSENRDHGQVQDLSMRTDFDVLAPAAFNSDTSRDSQNVSPASNDHTKTSVPSYEPATHVKNTNATVTVQSNSMRSKYNSHTTAETLGNEKHYHPEDISPSSRIVTSSRCLGKIFQKGECSLEKSLGPMILISEPSEHKEEARRGNEGLLNYGQAVCPSSAKECDNSASASFLAQESQAQSSESLLSKYINSKIPYFLLFLIFLITIYHYDFMIGLAFYLFSLYWLSWKRERQRESVKKE